MDFFLLLIAFIWIFIASLQDLRNREVWNWLNFSLILFALAYRAFYAVIYKNLNFFLYGLLGLGVFVVLGYIFYYSRIFAGGDAKLLFAIGPCLPFYNGLFGNLTSLFIFIVLLLFSGSIYGLIYSIALISRNRKKFIGEFKKQAKKYRKLELISIILALLLLVLPLIFKNFLLIGISAIFFLFLALFICGKAVENSCMIKQVRTKELTEGDWLYEKVRVGKKIVKPYWEGLSSDELAILRKYKGKVKIKAGIPFVPAFLFAFIIWIYVNNLSYLM